MKDLDKDFNLIWTIQFMDEEKRFYFQRRKIKEYICKREKELLLLLLSLEKRDHDLRSTIEWQLKGDIYKTDE